MFGYFLRVMYLNLHKTEVIKYVRIKGLSKGSLKISYDTVNKIRLKPIN